MIKVYLWDPIDRKAERFEIVTEKMKVSHKSISDTRETVNIEKKGLLLERKQRAFLKNLRSGMRMAE